MVGALVIILGLALVLAALAFIAIEAGEAVEHTGL